MRSQGILIAVTLLLSGFLGAAPTSGQENRLSFVEQKLRDGTKAEYGVTLPKGYDPKKPYRTILALPAAAADRSAVEAAFAKYFPSGADLPEWIVAMPVGLGGADDPASARRIEAVVNDMRLKHTVDGLRLHLLGLHGAAAAAFHAAMERPGDFVSVTAFSDATLLASDLTDARLSLLKPVFVEFMVGADDFKSAANPSVVLAKRLLALGVVAQANGCVFEGQSVAAREIACIPTTFEFRFSEVEVPADLKAVHAFLDGFHDAAAKADSERYFGAFAPEGVFFGTDPEERWTVAEFRKWAEPYFKEPPGWIFAAYGRNVFFAESGNFATFDEVAWSGPYGACRGTGSIRKIDGAWKMVQYNLSIPVPNDLADELLARMRGRAGEKTVILVRHAEKESAGDDPSLTEAGKARAIELRKLLRSTPVGAVFATNFKRTQETVAGVADDKKLALKVVKAGDEAGLVREIRRSPAAVVVVAAHSNTLPAILKELGVAGEFKIADSEFDGLYLVSLPTASSKGALTLLRYGLPSGN